MRLAGWFVLLLVLVWFDCEVHVKLQVCPNCMNYIL
ncbi:hypothetical protein EJB05_42240, partial [Eragrostis curvula]